jgi:hypothetical protein
VTSHNGSEDAPEVGVGAGPLSPVPAMPSVPGEPLYRGRPYLLLDYDVRHSLGWQHHRKAGPGFVVARLSRLGNAKVMERFPLNEQGWASAWQALSGRDAKAAAAIGAKLAEQEAARREAAALAALDAESSRRLRRVIFNGGSGVEPLAKGQAYDLRFLSDRIMVCRPGQVDAIVEVPYSDVETVEFGGRGQVSKSPGEQIALVLALGVVGAVLGLLVFGMLGLLLGAVLFALVGALVGGAFTKTETIIRIRGTDAELYFLHSEKGPDALRIELSDSIRAIGNARAAEAGDSDQPAELSSGSISDQLSKLASLLQQDLITRDEFEHLKARLIDKS